MAPIAVTVAAGDLVAVVQRMWTRKMGAPDGVAFGRLEVLALEDVFHLEEG